MVWHKTLSKLKYTGQNSVTMLTLVINAAKTIITTLCALDFSFVK